MKIKNILPRAIIWLVVVTVLSFLVLPEVNIFVGKKVEGFVYLVIMTLEITARRKKKKRKPKVVKPEDPYLCGSGLIFDQCHGNNGSSVFPGL